MQKIISFISIILIVNNLVVSQNITIEPVNPRIPLNIYTFSKNNIKQTNALPTRYDLREKNLVTEVKNKGVCGACWTFATMAAIESNWLKNGYGTFDLSEQNLRTCNGFFTGPYGSCTAGNIDKAIAYLVNGKGPVNEMRHPYNSSATAVCEPYAPMALVPEARIVPNNIETIKQCIIDYGALVSSMYYHDDYFNTSNYTYFCNKKTDQNHSVTLVGWNDTLKIGNNNGAWIVKNDFGRSWGDKGYFYVSYSDSVFPGNVGYFPTRFNYSPTDKIYGYDELGFCAKAGYGEPTGYALVKFTIDGYLPIQYIGTYLHTQNSYIEIEVYSHFTNGKLSGLLSKGEPLNATFPGYYLYKLPNPVAIENGNNVFIKIKYYMPGSKSPIPVEKFIENYAEPQITTNNCWISSTGESWYALGNNATNNADKIDVCIKAYTLQNPVGIKDNQTTVFTVYPNPNNGNFNIETSLNSGLVELYQISGKKVYETNINNNIININNAGLHPGVYFIRVTSGNIIKTHKVIVR